MSKQPFLPLFFGDLLASTATWSGEERALYTLLLAYQWTSGPLPKDPKRICRMCQYDARNFAELWEVVGRKFVETDEGLINLRLEVHREKSERISKANEERAKAGAAKRWGNAPSNAQSNAPSIPSSTAQSSPPSNAGSNAGPNAIHPIPSHPDPSQNHSDTSPLPQTTVGAAAQPGAHSKPAKAKQPEPEPPEFAEIRKAYPRRAGSQRWGDAVKHYRKRLAEGVTHDAILAGVKRYASFLDATGKAGSETVQQAATFLGDNRGYLEPWIPPTQTLQPRPLSTVERVRQANGVNRDERVVSEQRPGPSFDDLDLAGGDVREPLHAGIRRLGS